MDCVIIQNLARIVRAHRGTEGVRAFATRCGVSPATVSRTERELPSSLETLERFVTALAIDPRELFARDTHHGAGI